MSFFYESLIFGCMVLIGLPFFAFVFFSIISRQVSKQNIIDARSKTKWKVLVKSIIASSVIVSLLLYLVWRFYISKLAAG